MFDTVVTIVGNAITMPEWRRVEKTGALVTHFKVASNSRRFDRDAKRWIDGDSLRVRVNCWRRLAEGVASSVKVGDPVIVTGRLYTRDWTTPEGQHRVMYEMDAMAVGHDLARGRGKFERNRPNLVTSVVEDAETDARIAGQVSESVRELNERAEGVDEFRDDDPFGLPDGAFEPAPEPGADGPAEAGGADAVPDGRLTEAIADLDDVLSSAVDQALGDLNEAELNGSAARRPTVGIAGAVEAGRSRRGRSRVPVGA